MVTIKHAIEKPRGLKNLRALFLVKVVILLQNTRFRAIIEKTKEKGKMLVYYLVTMFSLCLMLGGLISIIINLALKKGEERTVYIRKFKMGKGILIYVFAIPLYWIAKVYEGGVVLGSLFSAIPHVLELIVLKYDLAPLQALMEASVFYSVAVYICFTLIVLMTLVLFLFISDKQWIFKSVTKSM